MRCTSIRIGAVAVLAGVLAVGCASSSDGPERVRSDRITLEEIESSGATNLYEVVSRLRPQWFNVTSRSMHMETEIVVFQNDMQLGGTDALRDIGPELAHGLRYVDGKRAAATMPGLMSGRHIGAVIIIETRPHEGG